jgi:hypothetical protein
VANIHCKAGKGRAGLMCCVALVRLGARDPSLGGGEGVQSARQALDLYDSMRVTKGKALTVTSQRKWVIFYEALFRQVWGITGDIGALPPYSPSTSSNVPAPYGVVPPQPKRRLVGVEVLHVRTAMAVKVFRVLCWSTRGPTSAPCYSSTRPPPHPRREARQRTRTRLSVPWSPPVPTWVQRGTKESCWRVTSRFLLCPLQ